MYAHNPSGNLRYAKEVSSTISDLILENKDVVLGEDEIDFLLELVKLELVWGYNKIRTADFSAMQYRIYENNKKDSPLLKKFMDKFFNNI